MAMQRTASMNVHRKKIDIYKLDSMHADNVFESRGLTEAPRPPQPTSVSLESMPLERPRISSGGTGSAGGDSGRGRNNRPIFGRRPQGAPQRPPGVISEDRTSADDNEQMDPGPLMRRVSTGSSFKSSEDPDGGAEDDVSSSTDSAPRDRADSEVDLFRFSECNCAKAKSSGSAHSTSGSSPSKGLHRRKSGDRGSETGGGAAGGGSSGDARTSGLTAGAAEVMAATSDEDEEDLRSGLSPRARDDGEGPFFQLSPSPSTAPPRRSRTSPAALLDTLRKTQELKELKVMSVTADGDSGPTAAEAVQEVEPPTVLERFTDRVLRLPSLLLCVMGVVPFGEGKAGQRYGYAIVLCVAAVLAYSLVKAGLQPQQLYIHTITSWYAFGGVLGMLLLRFQKVQYLLGPCRKPLEKYARSNAFWHAWQMHSLRQGALALVAFLCMCLCRLAAVLWFECADTFSGTSSPDGHSVPDLGCFILAVGVFSSLMYCQLHVCCGLEFAIDNFCVEILGHLDFPRGISEWVVVQALLRRAAGTIDWCLLSLGTSVLGTLLLTGVVVLQQGAQHSHLRSPNAVCVSLWCGWLLPPVFMLLYIVFRAAAVSERCSRVPALVNSWALEEGKTIDYDRQFAVQHFALSNAGFYVTGVRLSASLALKLSYLVGAVLFTVFTRAALQE